MSTKYPEVRFLGLDGIVVRFSGGLDDVSNRATLAFADIAKRSNWNGVQEIASALTSVLIRFDPLNTDVDVLQAEIQTLCDARDWSASTLPDDRKTWVVNVALGGDCGPQVDEAAAAADATADELKQMIASTSVRVLALGFAPGQPYLGLLPDKWNTPRQQGLTPKVPAGALVMAVQQLVIFANDTPTGWRHIGLTDFRLFRLEDENPVVLAPGDELTFNLVSSEDILQRRQEAGFAAVTQ